MLYSELFFVQNFFNLSDCVQLTVKRFLVSSRALFQFQAEVLLQLLFEMSAVSMHSGMQSTSSPLTDGICDDVAVQSHPFTTNFLLQFGDICYLVMINPFLENAPNTVVNRV